MVKEVVTAHSGALELTSDAGAGSTFTVRIPLTPTARSAA
jgi:signal transduction histidine kinase